MLGQERLNGGMLLDTFRFHLDFDSLWLRFDLPPSPAIHLSLPPPSLRGGGWKEAVQELAFPL